MSDRERRVLFDLICVESKNAELIEIGIKMVVARSWEGEGNGILIKVFKLLVINWMFWKPNS